MISKEGIAPIARHAAERGLARLMMRLPVTRATIRVAAARRSDLYELCGAYGKACYVLDRMRKDRSADPAIITEYESICAEIEADVLRILLGDR
ncbi:nodulation protein [Rhizobium sp. MC63]|uniref:Nodulation protein n=1 Tax=Rhizobium mulingense TaxID=3031128 RepID=A0ACC6MUK9_9HYPH|nr:MULTISPECIES: nodulation protein [unclassified Rhizobium]MDF0697182.1 nodulation protein [Rhizobium sp. MC63]MEA3516848.1 nodulation protein [Rhizobium sp. MJ31]MEB3042542.1 nodulation protein [Rhizobium sp. MJ21]